MHSVSLTADHPVSASIPRKMKGDEIAANDVIV